MDKDYDLVFETPRGKRSGYLIFMIEKQALNGVLNIGSANASFFGGTFDDFGSDRTNGLSDGF